MVVLIPALSPDPFCINNRKKQETQLLLTNRATRIAVNQGDMLGMVSY